MANLRSSVIDQDIKLMESFGDNWWEPKLPYKWLHKRLPSIRFPLIFDGLIESGRIKAEDRDKPDALKGIRILGMAPISETFAMLVIDTKQRALSYVGSGVGLMSEPLARLGAEVVGIDPAEKLHQVAVAHLKKGNESLNVTYICDTIESYCRSNKGQFDVVTFFDVAEHVADLGSVLKASVECLKPGGQIFLTTWNQTFIGWFCAIFVMEYVTGIIPRFTHAFSRFINPEKIVDMLKEYGCCDFETRGIWYNLLTTEWSFSENKDVYYAMKAVKRN